MSATLTIIPARYHKTSNLMHHISLLLATHQIFNRTGYIGYQHVHANTCMKECVYVDVDVCPYECMCVYMRVYVSVILRERVCSYESLCVRQKWIE